MINTLQERIASLALATFDQLPKKCKPRTLADGKREWTPLSAVVIALQGIDSEFTHLECVSLGTGSKCLSLSALKNCNGMILHDCHAEVLALRGFNYWLLSQIHGYLDDTGKVTEHPYLVYAPERRPQPGESAMTRYEDEGPLDQQVAFEPPFVLNPDLQVFLFSTAAPCGDASMELLISSKSPTDAVPWSTDSMAAGSTEWKPLGRGHFSILGAMRRKPARGDAEVTMSKSCTDKIALKQFTSAVAFPLNLLLAQSKGAYLKGLVVSAEQYNEVGYERAFGPQGRLQCLQERYGEKARFFKVQTLPDTYRRFAFERGPDSAKISNLSALWIAGGPHGPDTVEVLVNGVKQGFKQLGERASKASVVSRWSMTKKFAKIVQLLDEKGQPGASCLLKGLDGKSYADAKALESLQQTSAMKKDIVSKLNGWDSTSHEDNFIIHIPPR